MAAEPKTLGIILGGASVEHTISVRSARTVISSADARRWRVAPFAVTRDGRWLTPAQSRQILIDIEHGAPEEITAPQHVAQSANATPAEATTLAALRQCDAVFPLIHGATGEDGSLQGFLDTLGVPYVGAAVSASAIAMDKSRCKQLFRAAGIPVAPSITITCSDWRRDPVGAVRRTTELGYPQFVKPSRGGSSIGISRVDSREQALEAISMAFSYDLEVVIEEAMPSPREIECGVLGSLGDDPPIASPLGEIRSSREFYDYTAKYEDPATELIVPADVEPAVTSQIQQLALDAWRAVGAAGMARADFLLGTDGQLWLGELNTIPGFTSASMYPRLFEAAGLPLAQLIDQLVELGLERNRQQRLAATPKQILEPL